MTAWEKIAAPAALAALLLAAGFFSLAPSYKESQEKKERLAVLSASVNASSRRLERLGDPSRLLAEAAKKEALLAAKADKTREFFNRTESADKTLRLLKTAAEISGVDVALMEMSPRNGRAGTTRKPSKVMVRVEAGWRAIAGFVEKVMEADHPVSLRRLEIAAIGGYPPSRLAADMELEVFGL
ncbi:MAG: hypothetical protein ACNS63_08290 [Candidatus Nitrospinota bacterium M3_3B_026]